MPTRLRRVLIGSASFHCPAIGSKDSTVLIESPESSPMTQVTKTFIFVMVVIKSFE